MEIASSKHFAQMLAERLNGITGGEYELLLRMVADETLIPFIVFQAESSSADESNPHIEK